MAAKKSAGEAKAYHSIKDADASMTIDLLGGKGFHLSRMASMGLPVPDARVITTAVCRAYQADPKGTMKAVAAEVAPGIARELEASAGFAPLVSVRSGAKVSMPGMMDTILNVGLTSETMPQWEKRLGARAAWDSRRRLLQMYGSVALGVDDKLFAERLDKAKEKAKVRNDQELSAEQLRELSKDFEKIISKAGKSMPDTLGEQLAGAIEAVFKSWGNERAKLYRKINAIPDDMGTAVVIQRMVFGNLNENSATGVLFSRDPSTGARRIVGEFLVNAQGEDVVAGVRTPDPLGEMEGWNKAVHAQIEEVAERLERESRDMQDIEFTVEDGQLFLLQTRNAKRTALAAVKVATDLAGEGMISKREALSRISLAQYNTLNAPMIAPGFRKKPDAQGLAASTGIATGKAVFKSEDAVAAGDEPTILIAEETTPEDLPGIHAAAGILTATGGVTSHAAVVARGMDKVCVVGASDIKILKDKHGEPVGAMFGGVEVREGDTVTVDGAGGRAWIGDDVPVVPGSELPEVKKLNEWLYQVFPVYRTVTKVDELDFEYPMLFASYELDRLDEDDLYKETQDALRYLNGVIDLSTLEELADPDDLEILSLGGSTLDEAAFLTKKRALAEFREENGEKGTVKVYLGKRHAEHAEDLRGAGWMVMEPLASLAKAAKADAPFFSFAQSEQDRDKAALLALELARGGKAGCVPLQKASFEALDELAARRADGEEVAPVLALSAQQLMASALKP